MSLSITCLAWGMSVLRGELVSLHVCVRDVKKSTEHMVDMWGVIVRQRAQAWCDPLTLLSPSHRGQGTHLWGVLTWCPKSGCPLPLLTDYSLLSTTGLACRASPVSLQPQGQLLAAHLPHCCTAVQRYFPGNSSHPTMHWVQEARCLFFCFLPLFALCFWGMGIQTQKAKSTTCPGSEIPTGPGPAAPGPPGLQSGTQKAVQRPTLSVENGYSKPLVPGPQSPHSDTEKSLLSCK